MIELLGILIASFLGSLHCVGMCSPIAITLTHSKTQLLAYHLGRGASYIALGLFAGSLGHYFISQFKGIIPISMFLSGMGITLITIGVVVFINPKPHLPEWMGKLGIRLFQSIQHYNKKFPIIYGFSLGGITFLFPCGWLYGFVAVAASSGSALKGAEIMLAFFIGTLPAMSLFPSLVQILSKDIRAKSGKFSAFILVLSGILLLLKVTQ